MSRRDDNIEVFQDTECLCRENETLVFSIRNSGSRQQLILEADTIPDTARHRYMQPAHVVVSGKRTLEAAFAYKEKKVCVLNFASATNPGGGVVHGSSAQEECLCRCSTLYFNLIEERLFQGFYAPHRRAKNALYNDDCIYTPDVTVFKTDTDQPETMAETDWYRVNVITCAAPNLRAVPGNAMNPGSGASRAVISEEELKMLHKKRMRRIFDVAKVNGNEVLILGAFGCGAFCNPPRVVAEAFAEVMEDYRNDFEVIEYAVYCPPGDCTNYEVFASYIR